MRQRLQLAAILLLLPAAASARAQISNPDTLVAPLPQPPAHLTPHPGDDVQWLWPYTRPAPLGRANDLRLDARFPALLGASFRQPQAMWGPPSAPPPLAAIIPLFLTRYGAVSAEANRYLSVDGCVPSFCAAAGLLWIDAGLPHPLLVFAATNWVPEAHATDETGAGYNLWLFPSRALDPNALPLPLTQAIAHWNIRLAAEHRLVPHVTHALLVEPDGAPFALDPEMAGANSISPQPDTLTPPAPEVP